MTPNQVFSEAVRHVPALLVMYLALYATFWLLQIAKWPGCGWRDRAFETWGAVNIVSLGGFRFRALALISLVSLFLELLLIRWIASEIRIFAYFKSLVLIACFLGFGLGCYLVRKKIHLAYTLIPLLLMVGVTELPWDPVRRIVTNLAGFIGWFSDVHIWNGAYFAHNFVWGLASAVIALSIVIPLFALIAISFIPLGQLVGWYLANSSRGILAYSVNIVASIIGIWLYTLLCLCSTPPIIWFIVLGFGLFIFFWSLPGVRNVLIFSFLAITGLFLLGTYKTQWWGEDSWKGALPEDYASETGKPETFWSPYQKLTIIPFRRGNRIDKYVVKTNDTWYQQMLDLSDSDVGRNRGLFGKWPADYHQYNLPYKFIPHPEKVLIAGAGSGNDAAAALRHGAQEITCVEIDPVVYAKGRELHFEHPYDSDRVRVYLDDARSFIQNAKEQYDLIVFSILDSHTTSSYYTNIRLDNYVYTVEAMQATKKLLKPDGLFVMSFSSEKPWFRRRLYDVVSRGLGMEPLVFQPRYTFFVAGSGTRIEEALKNDPVLRQIVESSSEMGSEDAAVATDDWPYLYQQYRGIPAIVWILSLGLIGICWLTFRRLAQPTEGMQWHFLFLGAAFMLLEVQIISRTALLFGTTWMVNSIVITALLCCILLSNLVVSLFPNVPSKYAYLGLFGTLAISYLIPTHLLFFESVAVRGIVSGLLLCSPAFFAGVVFISSFKEIGFRAEAFGANLLGALTGGLLESLSYWTGIRALVIVAAVIYVLSAMSKSGRVGSFWNRETMEVRSS